MSGWGRQLTVRMRRLAGVGPSLARNPANEDVEPIGSRGYYCAMHRSRPRPSCVPPTPIALLAIVICGISSTVLAQRPAAARAGYKDLGELLQKIPAVAAPIFDEQRALWLGALPLSCLDRLQPDPGERRAGNGRGAAAAANSGAGYFWTATYRLVPDHDQVRAFWGCGDWHSAVASTWVAVRVLEAYPDSPLRDLTREKLAGHLGRSNLDGELAFFRDLAASINPIPSASQRGLFERPYGFAWLLRLDAELRAWPDSEGRRYAANMAPLAAWMADSLAAYFTALVEPVRAGTPTNTALSMTLALDYADAVDDTPFRGAVLVAARRLFLADTACAVQAEGEATPGGRRGGGAGGATFGGAAAIASPCLSEAALMARVLPEREYVAWLDRFLPPLESGKFSPLTVPLAVPDSAPGTERARRAGLSFSRAQSMERIARALPATDPRIEAWHRLAGIQAARGYELIRDDRSGITWLPAQALLYEMLRNRQ